MKSEEKLTPFEMIQMSNFSQGVLNDLTEDVFSKYNLTHHKGIKAAIRQAAWEGFVKGMEAQKKATQ